MWISLYNDRFTHCSKPGLNQCHSVKRNRVAQSSHFLNAFSSGIKRKVSEFLKGSWKVLRLSGSLWSVPASSLTGIIMDSSQFYCRVLRYFNLCWLLLGGFSSHTDTQPHAYIHKSKHIPIYGYRVRANICIWFWCTERGIHPCTVTTAYWNSEGNVWSVTFGACVFIQVPRCLLWMNKGPSPHAGQRLKRNIWSFFMYKRSQESLKVVFLL